MGCRESYEMWRGYGIKVPRYSISQDVFDGWYKDTLFDTNQYYVDVIDRENPAANLTLTMRSVHLKHPDRRDKIHVPPRARWTYLPEDITFWNVRDIRSGEIVPLWDVESTYLREGMGITNGLSLENVVAGISRTGIMRNEIERDEKARAMTPVGFAAINVLAMDQERSALINMMQNTEFRDTVLAIKDRSGNPVKLDFRRTEETLKLPNHWNVELDIEHPAVAGLMIDYIGYWTDNEDRLRFMRSLAESGVITYADIYPCLKFLYSNASKKGRERVKQVLEERGLINNDEVRNVGIKSESSELTIASMEMLAEVRNVKYFVPFLKSQGKGEEIAQALVREVKPGPYSATVTPEEWAQSNLNLLKVAQDRFGA